MVGLPVKRQAGRIQREKEDEKGNRDGPILRIESPWKHSQFGDEALRQEKGHREEAGASQANPRDHPQAVEASDNDEGKEKERAGNEDDSYMFKDRKSTRL